MAGTSRKRRLLAVVLLAGALQAAAPTAPASAEVPPPGPEQAPREVSLRDIQHLSPDEIEALYHSPRYTPTPDQGPVPPLTHRMRTLPERPWSQPRQDPPVVLPEIEFDPPGEKGKKEPHCTGKAGPHQKQLERYLKLRPVDGRQSAADCRAIQGFQKRHYVWPAVGYPGPVTWMEAKLEHARKHPNLHDRCPVRQRRIVCVDLSRQLMWVQRGKKAVFGPVPVRTGKPGHQTRTGRHSIYWRHKDHWSTLYDAPMPFSQFFSGGQAFHGSYGSLFRPSGSHGCINLRYIEAKRLWKTARKGDTVYVYGRKPRT